VASTSARYRKALVYPDHLWIGAKAVEVLHDRVRFAYRLVSRKHQALAAEGEVVVVSYDYHRGEKVPIPETIRAAIAALEAGGAPEHPLGESSATEP
jgi:acyl-CoA thioester hydrolase